MSEMCEEIAITKTKKSTVGILILRPIATDVTGGATDVHDKLRRTLSSRTVTSGATRMNSLVQNSYFGLRSNSMNVTKAPHGCGR